MGGSESLPKFEVSDERTFIITGANTGIGYETAKHVAQLGGRVVLACRSEKRAKEAISRMQTETEQEQSNLKDDKGKDCPASNHAAGKALNVQYMHLDLSSLKSTVDFAQRYKDSGLPLHVLICNAGIFPVEKVITEDGFERAFQVNYLSHFLLTLLLLPLLKKSATDCRIVNVSSMAHKAFRKLDVDNLQAEKSFFLWEFYYNSKTFQIMNMYSLSEKMKDPKISVFSLHPGTVNTEIARDFTGIPRYIIALISSMPTVKDCKDGSLASLNAALNPEYHGRTAIYFDQRKPAKPAEAARNKDYQDILWRYSLQCLRGYLSDEILQEVGESMASFDPRLAEQPVDGKKLLQDIGESMSSSVPPAAEQPTEGKKSLQEVGESMSSTGPPLTEGEKLQKESVGGGERGI